MLTVACVFWTPNNKGSGIARYYNASWVQKLKRNVDQYLSEEHRFICLTNTSVPGVDCIALKNPSWVNWWAKIELFAPNLFDGPVLYLDLDLFATSSLDDFVKPRLNLVMLRDHLPHIKNSSIMFWDGRDERVHSVYNTFNIDPEGAKASHRYVNSLGDQGFITDTLEKQGYTIDLWQDLLGEQGFIPFSMSNNINTELSNGILPFNTRLVYCLGNPKFHQFPNLKFVKDYWI